MCICSLVHVFKSEDNFVELVLSLHLYFYSRDWTQVTKLLGKPCWAPLLAQPLSSVSDPFCVPNNILFFPYFAIMLLTLYLSFFVFCFLSCQCTVNSNKFRQCVLSFGGIFFVDMNSMLYMMGKRESKVLVNFWQRQWLWLSFTRN